MQMLEHPYLRDVFNGGLVQHLSPDLWVRCIICTVVIPCHSHAPAETHPMSFLSCDLLS